MEMLRIRKPDATALPQQSTNTQASEGREGPLSQDHVIRIHVGIMIFLFFFGMSNCGFGNDAKQI
jgi:hypothetical protein